MIFFGIPNFSLICLEFHIISSVYYRCPRQQSTYNFCCFLKTFLALFGKVDRSLYIFGVISK